MPFGLVHRFSDPDHLAATIRAASVELTLTEAGAFHGQVTRIDLHAMWMQRISLNLGMIARSWIHPGRMIFTFNADPTATFVANGREIGTLDLAQYAEGEDVIYRSGGSFGIATLSLPRDEAMTAITALTGRDVISPRVSRNFGSTPGSMERLRCLHAAAGTMAAAYPGALAGGAVARELEQELIHAVAGCLGSGTGEEDRVSPRRHGEIMRRLHRLLEGGPEDHAWSVPEICLALGIPERTLRALCVERLGMGPKRYLMLRRLRLARRRLREADTATGSVTAVATELGFWELGRFAAAYQSVFGELPSATLRRPADAAHP